jgi:hypothetical protein
MKPNSSESLALFKTALGEPNDALTQDLNGPLGKAGITTGTGLVAYDLQAPALSLFPVLCPLRNSIPRVKGNGGTATNWKAVTGINTALTDVSVSEGNRGAKVTTTTQSYVATYKAIGLEDSVSFEADFAAEGFQDVKATAALNLLRAVMIGEEFVLLNANSSNALGTTPTPTLTASASGGTMATQGAASVICVALTPDGLRRSSVAGGLPATAIAKTNVDGSSDTINPGVALRSANATVSVTGATGSIAASVATVPGAVAYAWYVGATATTEKLAAITTINSVILTAYATTTQLASALSASDLSANTATMDGLLTFATKAGSGAYTRSLATGTAGTGTILTSDGAGNIAEIVAAFTSFWDNYRISPTDIWVAAQESVNITKKIIANGGAPLYRLTQDASGTHMITGGVRVNGLLNPITNTMVNVNIHPNMVAGTILFTSSEIPYPMNGVGNVMQVKCRRDYYQMEWPLVKRQYEYGVYADEVLQHYATFSLGAIYNIANG